MKLIEKAYLVWHDGMLDYYDGIEDMPVVYANSRNEAKTKATEPKYYPINREPAKYIDLKTKRDKQYDKVEYKGQIDTRYFIEQKIQREKNRENKIKKIEQLPDDERFLIQSGYVGNSVLWWAINNNGYTTDIDKAQIYTKNQIISYINQEDTIWRYSHVIDRVKKHVDAQYLNHDFKV